MVSKRKKLKREELTALLSTMGTTVVFIHKFASENDLLLLPYQTMALESAVSASAMAIAKLRSLLSLSPHLTVPHSLNPPFSCWFHRFCCSISDNDPLWFENFRMSKPTFTQLLMILIPSLQKLETCNNGGHSAVVPPDYKLGAALFRLAHAASFKSVGKRFGFDSAGACRAFYEVCKAVQQQLSHVFEFSSDSAKGFASIGLVNCCGVLSFSRFFVERPSNSDLGGEAGMILQGLVDSEGRFLDVSVGWPGSLMPESILRRTHLFLRVEKAKELLHGPPVELDNGVSMPQYILGDSCCPLLPWLLTPYADSNREDVPVAHRAFNFVHGQGMSLAMKAFGRVRSRWQLLLLRQKPETFEFLPCIATTACVLHNFLIRSREPMPDEIENYSEQPFPEFGGRNQNAEGIRDALASHISLVHTKH